MPLNSELVLGIVEADMEELLEAEQSYGESWKRRGGVDSFMMLARKWDRIEHQCKGAGWNILEKLMADQRPDGIMDDIRDLRRYLVLCEHEALMRGWCPDSQEPRTKPRALPQEVGGPTSRGYVDQG